MGAREPWLDTEQAAMLGKLARRPVAKLDAHQRQLAASGRRQHLAQQHGQALHLLTQRANLAIVEIDHQVRLVSLLLQSRGKTAGEDVLEAHEGLQALTKIASRQQQIADHIHRPWLHHLTQVKADVDIPADTLQRLPEARRVVVLLSRLQQRCRQRHAGVGAAVGVGRVEPQHGQRLVEQAAQGRRMREGDEGVIGHKDSSRL